MCRKLIAIAAFALIPALEACDTDSVAGPDFPAVELDYGSQPSETGPDSRGSKGPEGEGPARRGWEFQPPGGTPPRAHGRIRVVGLRACSGRSWTCHRLPGTAESRYLVYKCVIPLTVVHELVGGTALALWRKVGRYTAEVAEAEDQTRLVEWYEWLVRRLEEREARLPPGRASDRFPVWK